MFGSGFMYGLNLQKGCSPVHRETVLFHDDNLAVCIVMAALVGGSLMYLWVSEYSSHDFIDHKWLEVGWTLLPVGVLMSLALPSLELLYYMDSPPRSPFCTLKVMGRQWYWSYELFLLPSSIMDNNMAEDNVIGWDSYMMNSNEEEWEGFRLLEVDNPIFLPLKKYVRVLVTGGDVIHSFCVPSMGVKVDAVPGRLNQAYFLPLNLGSFYGQCSEICGANHSFMPMKMEIMPLKTFLKFFS